MKRSLTNPILYALVIISAGLFLFSCASIEPTAKATPSSGPTMEQAQKEKYDGPKARIAVTRFEDKSAKGKPTGEIGDGMAEMLGNALFATNRFIVLERQSLGDVLQEGDLGTSGRLKPETAAPIGEIEGADLLIRGTITEFEPGSGGAGIAIPIPGGVQIPIRFSKSHLAMIVKIIESKTSRVLASEQVEAKATDFGVGIGWGGSLPGALSTYSKTPMEKAIRVGIDEAVRVIITNTPKEYYRVSATPAVKASPPPEVQPTPPIEPPVSVVPPPPPPVPPTPPPPPVASLPPPVEPSPPKAREPQSRIAQVTANPDENLRETPNGKRIGKVKKGTSLEVLEEKPLWLRVRLEDGTEGWIWKASTSEAPKPSAPLQTPTTPKAKAPM